MFADGYMDMWVDDRCLYCMYMWIDMCLQGMMDGQTYVCMNGQMYVHMDGKMYDGQMIGVYMERWMD